ncbi:phosphoinositide kinase, FYVE-type zinc finger containing [Phyllostomus discolor]|uniref:Phosphoinositide kinase, FYVE-type zinc finger containing n=1 Tax=Phyllostomus discolor TaxID=89673 RepID=A0A834EFW5_9CHIR|nr:phosphoinositide kinase, FYVE-type zinc finger containing [Phyllostomus discolor]
MSPGPCRLQNTLNSGFMGTSTRVEPMLSPAVTPSTMTTTSISPITRWWHLSVILPLGSLKCVFHSPRCSSNVRPH